LLNQATLCKQTGLGFRGWHIFKQLNTFTTKKNVTFTVDRHRFCTFDWARV